MLRISIMIATMTQAIEKIRCSTAGGIFGANKRAPAIPASATTSNATVAGVSERLCPEAIEIVTADSRAMAVRAARTELGIAHLAGIERSHMGKIERGEHMPNLAIILRIAKALNKSASELIAATEKNLQIAVNATER